MIMKPQFRNWQTSLSGAVLAALVAVSEAKSGQDLADWKTWILPASIAFLGFLSRDAGRSTEQSNEPTHKPAQDHPDHPLY